MFTGIELNSPPIVIKFTTDSNAEYLDTWQMKGRQLGKFKPFELDRRYLRYVQYYY